MLDPFRLTICGLHELDDVGDPHATHVLSILDPGWPVPDPFARWPAHRRLELRFDDVVETENGVAPTAADVERILAFGRDLPREVDGHLLVHCHAGVSRSTAAMLLLLAQARPTIDASSLIAEIARIRPQAWPNLRIVEFGDAALGRNGTLVAALPALYAGRMGRDPELAGAMRRIGRSREVEAGSRFLARG